MEHAAAFLELVAKQVDPGAPGFWRDFLVGMLKPAAATAVVAMAVALSFSQRLGLEGEMLYAIARAFLQLSVIGFVLQFIFTQKNALWILLSYLFMVTVAGYTAGQRAKQVPRGKYIACVSILVGTAITMFLLVMLNVFPFTPRYIIPVAGMMVGNAMTVTGVTMKKLREDVKIQRNLVETALALGATPRQATLQQVKRSLVIALSPVIDNAKTVGLIALPGAMTGLIMGGASPLEAIQLQIVVMNMLMGASTNISDQVAGYTRDPGKMINRMYLTKSAVGEFGEDVGEPGAAEGHVVEGDPELIDDSEFYHQLLKEFLESCDRGASESAFYALRKQQVKKRKLVDRRASKSRKIRYHVHEKITNFMAPVPMALSPMAPKLFENLFGTSN
ncbi:UPF0014 membrane protein STAR2 [Panicum miliaceum]|uniref:UPF0014 membrane protein STAR2 n=1 Tax=Panicum miliaceum TaxID=4540 RepID=A0A3L6T5Z8_PANMI|nr:UPF0014 membrane protein STAR2 [Panicum miliaceum]